MDDIKYQYEELTGKLKKLVPFKAYLTRGLVRELRNRGFNYTLQSELTVINVFNGGDMSGITCCIEQVGEDALICSLTHLLISKAHPLFNEITNYQRKRNKRLAIMNSSGLN